MNTRIVALLVALGLGAGAGAVTVAYLSTGDDTQNFDARGNVSALAAQTKQGDWNELDANQLGTVLASLAQTLDEEIAERRAMAEEIESLREEVEALRGVASVTTLPREERRQFRREAAERSTADRLAKSGFTPEQVAAIRRQEAQAQMRQIELDDIARREGWLGTPRYFDELNDLGNTGETLRADLGEDGYDRYLYATGQPNRLVVGSIIETSPAERAGLRAGDVIRSYGGERVYSTQQLIEMRSAGERGEQVTVEVIRDGQYMQISMPRGPMGVQTRREVVDPATGRGG